MSKQIDNDFIKNKYSDTDEYICDDRYMLEEVQMINNMTDEEFENYISRLKQN